MSQNADSIPQIEYPRIVRIESEPGSYEDAIYPYMDAWCCWGVALNGIDGVGAILGVCRENGTKKPWPPDEADKDWRARFEITVWSWDARKALERLGLPEGGKITLETDQVCKKA